MTLTPAIERTLRRYALCVVALAMSLVVLPLLALAGYAANVQSPVVPRVVRNILFFWPQYLLLPSGVVDGAGSVSMASSAIVFTSAFWLAVIAAYVWLTRRLSMGWVLGGLLPFAALVVELGLLTLGMLDFRPSLDGP